LPSYGRALDIARGVAGDWVSSHRFSGSLSRDPHLKFQT